MEPLIELSEVSMRWADREILSGINLTVGRGDFLTVTGPNGGGKTTLMRILLRLQRPTEGAVSY
ncbi:MAG: ATP-binding cassette domain-containing protein, partial [Muribaculaceae bacterium]|nr:ATP-binding cassette domain-containing protein [Muribaculaceae bacterium]